MGPEKLTLHDIAALIVQIEPNDRSDWARVQGALDLVAEYSPPSVRKPIAEAVKKIDQITEGNIPDPSSLIADIGALVEEAIDAMEQSSIGPECKPWEEDGASLEAEQSNDRPVEADPDLLSEFITETRDLVASAEAALLELEARPENADLVNPVFRAFHTIKGTSAFLRLDCISELAHAAESFLSRIRDKEIHCSGGYADLAFRSVDMLKELIRIVQDALAGRPMATPEGLDVLIAHLADRGAPAVPFAATDQDHLALGSADGKPMTASRTEAGPALQTQQSTSDTEPEAESSVRVRTDRLDRLMEMVGELVIGHSMVAQDETITSGNYPELQRKVSHTDKIVRQMQDLCMSIRMVPLRATFQKVARLVRDLARRRNITIDFLAVGEDTEVDRNMVDLMSDPLMHLVRNAVDHGIEPPEEREKNGKPRTATLLLKAYHSGGSVVVEISDDGRGLDRDRIMQKAAAKGFIESGQERSDSEIINLIFRPGFSLADDVTDLSGRGVGLDVVRRAVEILMGRVEVFSEFGEGCTFSVRLPLTMAITDGMLVKVATQRYILPTAHIRMSFRPDSKALFTIAGQGEIVIFKGELMPIVRLHRLFDIAEAVEDPTRGILIIVGNGDQPCALLVDELVGQQQVVVKSLGAGIGKVQGISGGAILGDGHVGLILDPHGISLLARQASDPEIPRDGLSAEN